ncbi:hypothetical protein ACFL07_03265 [Pseudomonadota bacterium]
MNVRGFKRIPRKELIIHIGSAKTGSTALQKFLTENISFLYEAGICYPKSGRYSAYDHYYLFSAARPDEWYASKDVGTFEEEWMPLVSELHEALSNGSEYGLLSCTGFLRFNREQLEKIRTWFSEFKIRIVYYLRRQDELLMSVISQAMKGGDPDVRDIKSGIESYSYLLDFATCLAPFEDVFGEDSIQVLLFEKSQMVGGDVTQDFFSKVFNLMLKTEQIGKLPEENIGLVRDALEFKMLLNKLDNTSLKLQNYQHLLERYSILSRKHGEDSWNDVSLLSPMERLNIIRKYNDCNTMIANKYFGRVDGKLFYDPLPRETEPWAQYPGLSLSKSVEIADFIVGESIRDTGKQKMFTDKVTHANSLQSRDSRIRRFLAILWNSIK